MATKAGWWHTPKVPADYRDEKSNFFRFCLLLLDHAIPAYTSLVAPLWNAKYPNAKWTDSADSGDRCLFGLNFDLDIGKVDVIFNKKVAQRVPDSHNSPVDCGGGCLVKIGINLVWATKITATTIVLRDRWSYFGGKKNAFCRHPHIHAENTKKGNSIANQDAQSMIARGNTADWDVTVTSFVLGKHSPHKLCDGRPLLLQSIIDFGKIRNTPYAHRKAANMTWAELIQQIKSLEKCAVAWNDVVPGSIDTVRAAIEKVLTQEVVPEARLLEWLQKYDYHAVVTGVAEANAGIAANSTKIDNMSSQIATVQESMKTLLHLADSVIAQPSPTIVVGPPAPLRLVASPTPLDQDASESSLSSLPSKKAVRAAANSKYPEEWARLKNAASGTPERDEKKALQQKVKQELMDDSVKKLASATADAIATMVLDDITIGTHAAIPVPIATVVPAAATAATQPVSATATASASVVLAVGTPNATAGGGGGVANISLPPWTAKQVNTAARLRFSSEWEGVKDLPKGDARKTEVKEKAKALLSERYPNTRPTVPVLQQELKN